MKYQPINLKDKFSKFNEHWSPKAIAELNDYQFKVAKIIGEFIWHKHEETDEVFFVVDGEMKLEFRDGEVNIKSGEMFVVPKNIEHKPSAENECRIILIEPRGVLNTGNIENNFTAKTDVWV